MMRFGTPGLGMRSRMRCVVVNKQMRADPTRTGLIQAAFYKEITNRQNALKAAVKKYIATDNELHLTENVTAPDYEFATDSKKLKAFNRWLQKQINSNVLSTVGQVDPADPFTAKYIASAYKRGISRAWTDSNADLRGDTSIFETSRSSFLDDAFGSPESLDKIKLLATRSFEDMKNLGAADKAALNRILASGMANGLGVTDMASQMEDQIDGMTRSRGEMIARTETVRAHAEGQLDTFEQLGVAQLGVQAEWSTAGDDAVCQECQDASEEGPYDLDEARGLIPLHPRCRCAWVPYIAKNSKAGRAVDRIKAAAAAKASDDDDDDSED